MTAEVSVIVPCYNERGCIAELVERVAHARFAGLGKDGELEVIVVDDDSPDGTGVLCQSLMAMYPSLRVIIRKGERGLASAIRRGISEAKGQIIVVMDADLSHPPEMIPVLVGKVENGSAQIAVASRFVKGGSMVSSWHTVFGSKVLNMYTRTILRIPVTDLTGGFFAVKRAALEGLDLDSVFKGYGDYCVALLHNGARQGWHMCEAGFAYSPRRNGTSKTGFFRAGFSYGVRALKLRFGAT